MYLVTLRAGCAVPAHRWVAAPQWVRVVGTRLPFTLSALFTIPLRASINSASYDVYKAQATSMTTHLHASKKLGWGSLLSIPFGKTIGEVTDINSSATGGWSSGGWTKKVPLLSTPHTSGSIDTRVSGYYIVYSLTSKNAPRGHKSFSFCEQTLHKGLIDASCDWLQSTSKNRGQNNFLRKLRAKNQFPRLLFSSLHFISSYNPHTVLKNARRGRLKKYI